MISYLTVLENVLVPSLDPSADEQQAQEVLTLLEMDGLEDRFPYQLSGGQRQRVAVARTLVNRPKVIFADEPTASLDEGSAQAVIRLFAECRRSWGAALVLVTHSFGLAEGFDRVLELEA